MVRQQSEHELWGSDRETAIGQLSCHRTLRFAISPTSRCRLFSRSIAACTAGAPFSCVALALLKACTAMRLTSWRSLRISISS